MRSVVVHYQEIALKGRNRPWFIGRLVRNIRTATADLDVARVVTKIVMTHLPRMAIVDAVVVPVFGGLTLALDDAFFIKVKPTIVNTLFGCILLGGLYFGRWLLALVLDSVLQLDEEGWRRLTLGWGLFFFVLAALNEIVWRTQTQDFWVAFKVWGVLPLTMIFALAQTPLILKHELKPA